MRHEPAPTGKDPAVEFRTGQVDARAWRTTYAFDTLGRATTVSYQDGSTVTFAYDAASRRTGATDAAGVTTFTYDAVGRPTVVNNPGGRRVSVAYDSGGRRSTLTEPGGGVFTYAFDSASRMTGVQNPQGDRTTWAYDSLSRVSTLTYANTATVTYAYDAASRTTGVRNAKSDGTAIAGFVYTLDDAGNPTGMVLSSGDRVTWTYDSLNRLTREQRDGANAYDITYTYDSTSNRLTKLASGATTTYAYDNADALLTENAGGTVTTYTWDDAGNNTLVQAAGGTTTMTWDGENRLSTIQLPAASVVTNTYGFDGLRRKREDGTTTKHLWDAQRLLLETDGSDTTQAVYTSSLGAYGSVVSQRRASTTSHLHPDHLGTIWSVTGADQTTSDTYLFDAWGKQLTSSGSTTNPHRYVGALGYYTEPTLSLDYVRARWLRPGTGSWVSLDPVASELAYSYSGARPMGAADPSGSRVLWPNWWGTWSGAELGVFVAPTRGRFEVGLYSMKWCGERGFMLSLGLKMSVDGPSVAAAIMGGDAGSSSAYAGIPITCSKDGVPQIPVCRGDRLSTLQGFGFVVFGTGIAGIYAWSPPDVAPYITPDWYLLLGGLGAGFPWSTTSVEFVIEQSRFLAVELPRSSKPTRQIGPDPSRPDYMSNTLVGDPLPPDPPGPWVPVLPPVTPIPGLPDLGLLG